MARKIFMSYKHSDSDVHPLNGETTARVYVDNLIELFEGDEIYKGEGDEDLSDFQDETIASHLRDKIYDSSMTIILISPQIKDPAQRDSDQWIPWEIAYSLKEITRNDRTSKTNATLAIVLPDGNSSYTYYLEENTCQSCHCRLLKTHTLFQIMRDNMFNQKNPTYSGCLNHPSGTVYKGDSCYIYSVKWSDLISDKDKYLCTAERIKENIGDYKIVKEVKDG